MASQTRWRDDSLFLFADVEEEASSSHPREGSTRLRPLRQSGLSHSVLLGSLREGGYTSVSSAKESVDAFLSELVLRLKQREEDGRPVHRLYFQEDEEDGWMKAECVKVSDEVRKDLTERIKGLPSLL